MQQIRVGIFTVLALLGAFVVIVVVSNLGLKARGYQIAVHFVDVGGLQEGATVLLSGVTVGEVTKIVLLPDQTVDVIATIDKNKVILKGSQFLIATSLTGQATLLIRPPRDYVAAEPMAHGVPPEFEQPWGALPATIADLVGGAEARMKSLDKTLASFNRELPRLAAKFDAIATHTDALITHTDTNLTALAETMRSTATQLNDVVAKSGHNVEQLTTNLNGLVTANKPRLQELVDSLSSTAKSLNTSMQNFASLTSDPSLHKNVVETAANIKDASERMKQVASDLQGITGDPKVQSQLKGAVYDLSSAIAKANDILGTFSSAEAHSSPLPGATPAAGGTPVPGSGSQPRGHGLGGMNLIESQVRESWIRKGNGGPTSDVNITLLPRSSTSVTFGVNDLGYNSSFNFLINKRATPNFTLSGGVLYSKLGAKAVFQPGALGVDARFYDPKHPTLDLYGDVRLSKRLQLFYGERNVMGSATPSPTFGIQGSF
ncbi:MAG TPA: MlaD family protein [Candidatus Tumulicola sp.]|nr:MlaD family protein [Candidatus Tumulicola sp.]